MNIQRGIGEVSRYIKIIQRYIALIDDQLHDQVNVIIHHPRFQRLEASWRGLYYLVNRAFGMAKIKTCMLDVSWDLLVKDINTAIEFDQSQIFKCIYNNEFDHPGGEPFGLLIGDYFLDHNNAMYVEALRGMAKVAAAAFAPFIAAASPSLFGVDSFADIHAGISFNKIMQQAEYLYWKKLREDEDTRFVGLVMPRVLMREPYSQLNYREKFYFTEKVTLHQHYLWGNAVYCFAAVVVDAFDQTGWFTKMVGSINASSELSRQRYLVFNEGLDYKPITETTIGNSQEAELSNLGFIPLCECKYVNTAAFYNFQSIQSPKTYDSNVATINAKLPTMLHYLLCVSRFAHYIKVIMRNKTGSFTTPEACESYLQNWLLDYISETVSADNSNKYPLKAAKVDIKEHPNKPGAYFCIMHLQPHYLISNIKTSLVLMTEISI